jgi:hypothetical protein
MRMAGRNLTPAISGRLGLNINFGAIANHAKIAFSIATTILGDGWHRYSQIFGNLVLQLLYLGEHYSYIDSISFSGQFFTTKTF